MNRSRIPVLFVMLLNGAFLGPLALVAQESEPSAWRAESLPSVDAILRGFVCETKDWGSNCDGQHIIIWIRHHLDGVPQHKVVALLDGLEELAVHHGDPDVRASAVSELAAFGMDVSFIPNPMDGILARLLRVYALSDDDFVRFSVVSLIGRNVESAEAVAFLKRVAQQDSSNEDFEGAAKVAVRSLSHAGPLGTSTLSALHIQDRVSDPDARRFLEFISEFGYREVSAQQLRN